MNNFSKTKHFWIGYWHKYTTNQIKNNFHKEHSHAFDNSNERSNICFVSDHGLTINIKALTRFISIHDGFKLEFSFQDLRREILSLALKVSNPKINNTQLTVSFFLL